jgi:sugar phosphate isomerase/epimerase
MILSGIADEAGALIDTQIAATRVLGWRQLEARAVEVPGFPKANLHDLPQAAFEIVVEKLQASGVAVHCFGSTIMNWAKKLEDPFEITLAEVRRAIPRMQRLGTRFVRIMSFKPGDAEDRIPSEALRRVGEVTRMFLDAGLQPVHENCMNYGGMSWEHALHLLEHVPGLQWVFDTANPVFNPDRRQPRPWPRQDAWEFYTHVKPWIVHVHIKDARWNPAKNEADYTFPGDGDGAVRAIVRDLLAGGYEACFSIEPHLAVVFHDASVQASADAQFNSYVEYGRRLERMIGEIRAELGRSSKAPTP